MAIVLAVFLLPAICGPAAAAQPFNLEQRRQTHWAWKPVQAYAPPHVADDNWVRDPIDRFILCGLEQSDLRPAAPADRRTLIRRVSFALIGLPPTPQQVEEFVNDASPDAYEKVVDRLLASPHFGEHWARHWMDLVRYSDTLGNESDAPIPNAWRYRDYLIRAFNSDLPYDQLVREHIAGDLLEHPRINSDGCNESIIGTGFFWLNEDKRSPVDVKQAQADCFDNKIDVMCKTFLGLTVGCARCHDHKFDAISQADYYALYGYLKSSRYTQALLNSREVGQIAARLASEKSALRLAAAARFAAQASNISRYLLAASSATTRPVEQAAADSGLLPERVTQWTKALDEPMPIEHPLYPWARLRDTTDGFEIRFARILDALRTQQRQTSGSAHREGDIELSDFTAHGYAGWFSEDQAFGAGPLRPGDFLPGATSQRPVLTFVREGAWAHSAAISRRLQGTLRSPTFTIDRRYLHVRCAGRGVRVNVNIEHFVMIQDPLYGALRYVPATDAPQWHTFDLSLWKDRRAYVEFADTSTPDLHDLSPTGINPDGYLAVGGVVLSDQGPPPTADPCTALDLIGDQPIRSLEELAGRYQQFAQNSIAAFERGELPDQPHADARAHLLAWLLEHGLLDGTGTDLDRDVDARVGEILREIREIEAAMPDPQRAPATIDGDAEDEFVFLRGDHKHPGPLSPRRMLQAIAGDHQPPAPKNGSGRSQLAARFVDPANPFITRALVNRVWHHLLGRGIVASVDNLGALGDAPTHPQLLDYLSDQFVKDGWSIKKLIRHIVLSNTFQMSSRADSQSEARDPDNKVLHRANVRRLEAEAIHDEILSVSGTLNENMYGPGVEVYLTPFLLGNYVADYGRPKDSGPLDGDGRRSLYTMVRRNFLPPMMVAFDFPPPINTAGRRTVSNVPAQALILMNDPFVAQEAQRWGRRIVSEPGRSAQQRITRMYLQAFARPPQSSELAAALRFIDRHGQQLNIAPDQRDSDPLLWADLAHVLINVKEFIFLN